MQEVMLTDRGTPWVKLTFDTIRAQGRIRPALRIDLHGAAIADLGKRTALDQLVRQLVNFLHEGRHPSDNGPQQGQFPVDHRDTTFALAMSKFFLSYIAQQTQA